MKWFETIALTESLQDVRLNAVLSASDVEGRVRAAEQAAYERGRLDGEKRLSEQLVQQRKELLELQQGVLESLHRAVPEVVQQTEATLVQIALESAQKIVAGMPVTGKLVEAIVREAVAQTKETAEVTIQLHPDDLALLRKHQSPILEGLPDAGPLRFMSTSEITRGGCLVQTRFGLLDARRETKIEQLRKSLAK
ncbi:MAG TPA: FliH/SctL family protein [Candidatus Saccharimonadales bacterium]|nr:FliH/SctL family protein [Candidatus Saccharimonadales bacterium]